MPLALPVSTSANTSVGMNALKISVVLTLSVALGEVLLTTVEPPE